MKRLGKKAVFYCVLLTNKEQTTLFSKHYSVLEKTIRCFLENIMMFFLKDYDVYLVKICNISLWNVFKNSISHYRAYNGLRYKSRSFRMPDIFHKHSDLVLLPI